MATLNFKNSAISFSDAGLKGEQSLYPTAIDFARSGEPVLFVTQQDGAIWRYVVEKGADGAFSVTKAHTPSQKGAAAIKIDAVQKVLNYDDDGSKGPVNERQVTGLAVTQETIGGVASATCSTSPPRTTASAGAATPTTRGSTRTRASSTRSCSTRRPARWWTASR